MVAALSVGAEPVFVPATRETGYLPDFDAVSPDVLNQRDGGLSLFSQQSSGCGCQPRLLGTT